MEVPSQNPSVSASALGRRNASAPGGPVPVIIAPVSIAAGEVANPGGVTVPQLRRWRLGTRAINM
jgi:hypothetical protein